MKVFSFIFKVHTTLVLINIPILSFLLLHSPILSCDGALIVVMLVLWWIYFMPNIEYIMYGSVHILRNSKYKKTMCERLAFPCSWITSFHEFGFKIERVLYQLCMRNFIWVWFFWRINLYYVYGHYISCYYMNHLFYCSCAKLKLVM